jgi:competence protein ComEC
VSNKQQSKILYIGITGFILGIFYAEFFEFKNFVILATIIFSLSFISKKFYKILVIIFLISFAGGFLRLSHEQNKTYPLDQYIDQHISVRGVVVSEVSESAYYRNFHIKPLDMDSQKILVRTSYKDDIEIGEELIVSGNLEMPRSFSSETGIEFNYPGFLQAKGVGYILPKAWIEKTGVTEPSIKRNLFEIKDSFIKNIKYTFNFPESALLAGLLVGSKESLGDEYLERFRVAGLSHIIVLSGFNIAIVAAIIMSLTFFLPRSIGLVLSALGVLTFSLMVGFESTVLRATLMVLVAIGGKFINRSYDALRALLIAGFMMLLFNPHLLLHDVSFELSFLASLSLILIVPVLEPYFSKIPAQLGLREIIVSTVSVELLVIPMILYRIGEVSVVSLLSNILVLPIVAPTMLFGFLSGLFGYVSHTLAVVIGYPAFLFLRYELFIVDFVSQFEYALVSVGNISFLVLLIIYLCIFIFLVKMRKKED